jgi:hypothetical protein
MSDDVPPPEKEPIRYSQGHRVPPPFVWQKHSEEENALIRRRQKSRAIVTALLLGAIIILFFFISVAKIRSGTP